MTKKGILILIGVVGVIGLVVFIFTGGLNEKKAAISLDAYPQATVYINGQEAGTTPYENDAISAGEAEIKLVPQQGEISTAWERKIFLNPGTHTFINWEFNSSPELSGGRIIYLEKTGSKDKAGLSVVCKPDDCSVSVDGQMRGFTPLNFEDISEGEHRISISAPQYQEVEVMARALNNYKLSIVVDLIKQTEEISEIEELKPTRMEAKETVVTISETPTGWLRVREGPGRTFTEVGRVNPGEEFPFIEEGSGWYKIEYEDGEEGWVSADYAEKSE